MYLLGINFFLSGDLPWLQTLDSTSKIDLTKPSLTLNFLPSTIMKYVI